MYVDMGNTAITNAHFTNVILATTSSGNSKQQVTFVALIYEYEYLVLLSELATIEHTTIVLLILSFY